MSLLAMRWCCGVLAACAVMTGPLHSQTLVLQEGVSGGVHAETESCVIASAGTVTEADTLTIGTGRALVAFPNLIGSAPGQVPAGATITSATLELHVLSVPGAAATRTVNAYPLYDIAGLGPWQEPAQPVTAGAGVGVSWTARDDRPGIGAPWLFPGGDFVQIGPPIGATALVNQGIGVWYSLDVTQVVGFLADGFSNLGWILATSESGDDVVIAADDHPTATLRPRLTVTWSGTTSPFNRVPSAADLNLSTSQGAPLFVPLIQFDGDGENVTYVVRERPQNGVLNGSLMWTYKPSPGFVGTDTWTYYAHDGFSSSRLATVTITVNADPAGTSGSWSGGAGAGQIRSASFTVSTDPGNQVTQVGPELIVQQDGSAATLDLPNLFAAVSGGIPPGATIIQAGLELTVTQVDGGALSRSITAWRVNDPAALGTWFAPAGAGSAPDSGVSWLYRDARPTVLTPWLIPGGDRADSANTTVTPSDVGSTVPFDVTAAFAAWAAGASNQGFLLTSGATDAVRFASETHANSAYRPRVTVVWRAPGAGGSNLPPVAAAGADRVVVANQLVTLDATGSYDPEGLAVSYFWFQESGPTLAIDPTQPVQTFTTPTLVANTDISFTLVVVDAAGQLDFDPLTITVVAPAGAANGPPIADAGPDQNANENNYVLLQGSGSFDPEGATLTTSWTQVTGPQVDLVAVSLSPSAIFQAPYVTGAQSPLPLVFRIEVSDGTYTTYDLVTINVIDQPNDPPTADAGPSQTVESESWTGLDARASSDPNAAAALTYSWLQTQGPSVTVFRDDGPVPYFKLPNLGASTDLVFQVTVSDGELTDTATTTVTTLPHPAEFTGDAQSIQPYSTTLTPREARHLMRRVGYGASPADLATIVAQGLNATIATLMNPVATPTVDAAALLEVPTPLVGDLYPQANLQQVSRWWLVYKLQTPWTNSLKERMAYFLHDLYATGGAVADNRERHWQMQHLSLLRDDPFPNYRQFLIDLTHDDLMLDWLDNHRNRAGAPNENYAREFWELFTLGVVDPFTGLPNYTETDIQESSRAFTGWEIYDPPANPSDSYYSRFNPSRHDPGMKTVLGFTGSWKDEDIVDITLTFPQAAEFIVLNLFRFFCHENPSQTTVQSLATVLTSNGWQIGPVVETILGSEAMFSSASRQDRIKTPTEYVVGFVRSTGLVYDIGDMYGDLSDLGHVMGQPPNVKGWIEGPFWLGEAASAYRAKAINHAIEARGLQPAGVLDPLLPTPGLRSGPKTVAHLLDVLDIGLQHDDQFHSLVEYMDTIQSGANVIPVLFDGDNLVHQSRKLRGALFILAFVNPEYHLN